MRLSQAWLAWRTSRAGYSHRLSTGFLSFCLTSPPLYGCRMYCSSASRTQLYGTARPGRARVRSPVIMRQLQCEATATLGRERRDVAQLMAGGGGGWSEGGATTCSLRIGLPVQLGDVKLLDRSLSTTLLSGRTIFMLRNLTNCVDLQGELSGGEIRTKQCPFERMFGVGREARAANQRVGQGQVPRLTYHTKLDP
ncbi:hypothetical protein VTK73DRAFT_1530 [Phialemonium thermophilum]|uniref:ATP-dependent DNA helicase n=1 Tax=Phialemonium thermophilum TaxID=223376 RepID=A0ABR3VTB8_9PEZI